MRHPAIAGYGGGKRNACDPHAFVETGWKISGLPLRVEFISRSKRLQENSHLLQFSRRPRWGIASGLGFNVVQSLEGGNRLDPPASEIIALCKALNVSADELLGLK
jgi:hypothetical protein